MTALRSIVMAFSMFSHIPMPRIEWDDKSMRYMLAAFPLVGVVIALLLWGWLALCDAVGFGALMRAAGIVVIPIVVTGGFHLDGLADTADALASHAEPQRKREILKDSHLGAFAAIWLGVYLVAYVAFASELLPGATTTLGVCLAPVLSRTMSGIVSSVFPSKASQGLLHTFRDASKKRGTLVVLAVFAAACLAYAFVLLPWQVAVAIIVAVAVCTIYLYVMSQRQFEGITGDLSGCYLQLVELAVVIAIVIAERVMLL